MFLQISCLPPFPPLSVDVKWLFMTGNSMQTKMKRILNMAGSNIDWGEPQIRFNILLYYIFASFWSRSTNFCPRFTLNDCRFLTSFTKEYKKHAQLKTAKWISIQ